MGQVVSSFTGHAETVPSVVLVPPILEKARKNRSRFAKSSYDRQFVQPQIKRLFETYAVPGAHGTLNLVPPEDPRAPHSFADLKARLEEGGAAAAVRLCAFDPSRSFGAHCILPLQGGTSEEEPSAGTRLPASSHAHMVCGARYSSPGASVGAEMCPSDGQVLKAWAVARVGSLIVGVQTCPGLSLGDALSWTSPAEASSKPFGSAPATEATHRSGSGWEALPSSLNSSQQTAVDLASPSSHASSASISSPRPVPPFSPPLSLPCLSPIWRRALAETTSFAVAYAPPRPRTQIGSFAAVCEVQRSQTLRVAVVYHAAVQRHVRNPFEARDVVGITNYFDVGLQLIADLGAKRGEAASTSGSRPPLGSSTARTPPPSMAVAGSWQLNKNVLVKARVGTQDAAVACAFRSWSQPSLTAAVSATRDWRAGRTRLGASLDLETFGRPRYERSAEGGRMAGGRLTQRHVASSEDLAFARGEGVLVQLPSISDPVVLGQDRTVGDECL
ncbi:hypothetical protein H632_c410p0 [Helicosporidium sp. ATCC 50920]|nr:hypothetical protein H632_c410p0 [Helicosporidium sp. ATCC 50920]|eukprot:KDD75977.1 hypothetical protein H632_c410p0 [Helicosporidium sp. ATCC 50920]